MDISNVGVPGYNRSLIALASSAYTTDQTVTFKNNGTNGRNHTNKGLHVILDVTAKTLAPTSLTLSIKGIDPASGKSYNILSGAAVTGISTNVYTVFPGADAAANQVANDTLPLEFEIVVTGTGVDADNNFTYSVGVQLF